jgi:putative nucleotidyltransferase with HDIG domain
MRGAQVERKIQFKLSTAGFSTNSMDAQEKYKKVYVSIYTTIVILLGLVIVSFAVYALPSDRLGFLIFALLAATAELTSIELFVTSRQSRVSISSVIAIASILLFGPLAGALTHMASGVMTAVTTKLFSELPEEGRVSWWHRTAFNIGMLMTAATAAGAIFVWTGGSPGNVNRVDNLLPLMAATSADTVVNLLILIGVLTLQTGRKPFEIWRQNFQWAAPIAILGGVLGGGALALAYEMFSVLGIGVFLLPVLLTSYSFRLYTSHTKEYVNKLEQLNQNLDQVNLSLLEALASVIDAYDVYTAGHSTQVAVYTEALAEKMGLPARDKEALVRAALIHDIGKVGITDSLISKPGPLTPEEYNIVKRHAEIGADIVNQMTGLQELVPLVRHHHENWDGNGYPDGLSGEQIPLGARILALADALDTICSDRPYRPTRSFKEVLQEIRRCSGTQFDPAVVKAFFDLVDEKDRGFFKNSAATVDKAVFSQSIGAITRDKYYMKKSMVPKGLGDVIAPDIL